MDIIEHKNLSFFWDDLSNKYGNKKALIFESEKLQSFSYKELNIKINQAANLFISLGIQKGDKVALHLHNCPEFIIAWFGLCKIGAIMMPINAHYLYDECLHLIKKCKPKLVITQRKFLYIYENMQKRNNVSFTKILHAREENESFNALLRQQNQTFLHVENLAREDIAEILFTSGTTSHPKGVLISHYNLLFAAHYTAWQIGLRNDDIYLSSMPSWHVDFQCTALMPSLLAGATFVMLERYSAKNFWKQICSYQATITEAIPKIIYTLLMQPAKPLDKNHKLREVLYYLCMPESVKNEFTKRFNVKLLSSYGMSETIVGAIAQRPYDTRKWPSIGKVGFCYEVKIVDEKNNPLPCNNIGEICIKGEKGKNIFAGYYEDKINTDLTLRDGWIYTGDMGYVDEQGHFYFVDRKIDLIKSSGENVSSVEIENLLLTHPKIQEACVVGMKDTLSCEAIQAFVVPKEEESLNEDEIKEFCLQRIAKFKIPKSVEICKYLPKTSTGKVQKAKLKGLTNKQIDKLKIANKGEKNGNQN